MNLFEMGPRSEEGYKKQSQSRYSFLDQSAWPQKAQERALLEQWFHDYPRDRPKDAEDVYIRFRSTKDDKQHYGAFFELYCSALLQDQGFTLKTHQSANTTKETCPDFLAYVSDIPVFHLEATVVTGEEIHLKNQRQQDLLFDALNEVASPDFDIYVDVMFAPLRKPGTLPIGNIQKFIRDALAQLDYREELNKQRTDFLYEYSLGPWLENGWKIRFAFSPKSPERVQEPECSSLLSQSFPVEWTTDEQSQQKILRKKLKDKTSRYGDFERPYIVAINTLPIMNSKVLRTVFFDEDGLWSHEKGKKQQVSAVLFISGLGSTNIARSTPILWHNLWAEHPLDKELWQGPQMVYDIQNRTAQLKEGKTSWEMLHLHPDWPNEIQASKEWQV